MEEQAKKSFIINVVFAVLWVLLVFLFGKFLLKYLLPFVISFIISGLVQKPAHNISLKLKVKKGTVAAVLSAGIYIVTVALAAFVILCIFNVMGDFITSITNLGESLVNFVLKIKNTFKDMLGTISPQIRDALEKVLLDFLNSITQKMSEFLSSGAAGLVKSVPSLLFSSTVTLVSSCYIAKDFDRLKVFFKSFVNEARVEKLVKIKEIIKASVLKMLTGYLIIFLLTFVELLTGLMLLGVKNFLLIAVVISVVDILPVLGAGTVLLPWGVFNILLKNTGIGIGLVVLYTVIVVIRNFIEPKIVGDKTGISPLFMLVAIFLGLKLFGFWGLIILPVTLVVTVKYYKSEM